MDASRLLHLYRRDRRNLLEFVLSSAPAGTSSDSSLDLSSVDLDTLSIDYVLDRVQSGLLLFFAFLLLLLLLLFVCFVDCFFFNVSGGGLDFSEGKKQFFDEMKFPVMVMIFWSYSSLCLIFSEICSGITCKVVVFV